MIPPLVRLFHKLFSFDTNGIKSLATHSQQYTQIRSSTRYIECARTRCRTFFFPGPKRAVTITDHFPSIFSNLTFSVTFSLCKKTYVGETCPRLGNCYHAHLRDVEINHKDASKPVAQRFNLPSHSQNHTVVRCLSLHLSNTESRKNMEQKFIQLAPLAQLESATAFHSCYCCEREKRASSNTNLAE